CRFFDTPVTGGNVSFYNESPNAAVYPTPTIGRVGLIEKVENITTSFFKEEGNLIYVLGEDFEELGGSEYLKVIHNKVIGDSPKINLEIEIKLLDSLLGFIEKELIESAHDVSEGGIISAIAECCIIDDVNPLGAEVNIPVKSREEFSLFSESQSRVIVSIRKNNKDKFESYLNKQDQTFTFLGETKGTNLSVNNKIKVSTKRLSELYYNTIPNIMNG
ncbi:MAG: AIR synthase-related protein, partial [Ignavibacteriaceae bacterium]